MRNEEILQIVILDVVVWGLLMPWAWLGGSCPAGKGQDLGRLLVITENKANTDPTLTVDLFLVLFLISFQGLIYDHYLPSERVDSEAAGLLGQPAVLV